MGIAPSWCLAGWRQEPAPTQVGSDCGGGKTISACGGLWFGVLLCEHCFCDGLTEEAKEVTPQGVTLFVKLRGIAEPKTSLGAPVLRLLLRVSPMCVHLSDPPRKVLTKQGCQAFTVL